MMPASAITSGFRVDFTAGNAHVRNRRTGECLSCIPLAVYAIVRAMAIEDRSATSATQPDTAAEPTGHTP